MVKDVVISGFAGGEYGARGALQGYEPDPLAIGLAWTKKPAAPQAWTRLVENPVLSTAQPDVRSFESVTLYKSAIIRDKKQSLGWPFVMFYNGKTKKGNHEAIGMAVSKDMINWTRYGDTPVVDNAPGKAAITGDPQLTKIGEVWYRRLDERLEKHFYVF